MAQSKPLAPFDPNDAYRYKNKEAVDTTIPHLLRTVLLWGSSLSPGETFWGYLENKYGANIIKQNKALGGRHEKRLKTTDSGDFDVTLLKDLIPEVCEDFDCKDQGKKRLADGVKTCLSQLADIRNKVCSRPNTFAISPTVLEEIGAIASKLLDKAAKLFSVDPQTKQENINELKKMLKELEENTMIQKEKRLIQMMNYFLSEGKKEIEKVVMSESKEFLPAGKLQLIRRDVFHVCDVTVGTDDANSPKKQKVEKFRSGSLLQHCKGSDIILLGKPGAGKSTFVRRLREDFVAKKELVFRGVSEYEMMICMECRKSGIETLADLVRSNFPATFRRIEADHVVEVLLMMKILFVVDGVDERNPCTEKLLHILVDTFARSERATFIFASRPGATKYLETELHRAGRSPTTAKLQPITEEQERIVFLKRYQEKIPGIDAPELINAYKDLNETCKDILNRPVHLALFCYLCHSSPDEVSKWRNEISIMTIMLKYSQNLMEKILQQNCVNNPGLLGDQIMEQACVMSLRQMAENKLTITSETYKNFCKNLFGNKDVPYEAILSCLYVSQPDQETYEYIHLSHLEFMAAKAIITEFVDKKRQSVIEIISEHAGLQRNDLAPSPAVAPLPAVTGGEEDPLTRPAEMPAERRSLTRTVTAWRRRRLRFLLFRDGAATSPAVTDGEDVSLKRFENVLRFVCMLINEGGQPMLGAQQRFLEEICPALAREGVGFKYWIDLVLGCPDSDQIARAAADAAHTVDGRRWTVRSARAMTATSKMLPYRQPSLLDIEPVRGEEDPAALAELLGAVTRWHTGELNLVLRESHANYSACDASLACLESARCKLRSFMGCLSGGSSPAWSALVKGAEGAGRETLRSPIFIRLLDATRHELGPLDGTDLWLWITVRPPTSPGYRCRRPLPTSPISSPDLGVECRPAAEGKAPCDEEAAAALIEDLAPRDMKYSALFLLHYPGPDGALDGMASTLRARGVWTQYRTPQCWEEAGSNGYDGECEACEDSSSHRPGERCVRLLL